MAETNHSGCSPRESKLPSAGGTAALNLDLTDRRQAERELVEAKEYAENIVETVHEPLIVLTPELIVKSANAAFYEHFQVSREETLGRRIYDLGNGQWNIPALRRLLEEVLPAKTVFNDYEVRHDFETIGARVMLVNARRLDHAPLILLGIRDITDRRQAEEALRRSEEKFSIAFHESLAGMSISRLRDGLIIDVNERWLALFGLRREEVIGNVITPQAWRHPEERNEMVRDLEQHSAFQDREIQFVRAGGEEWIALTAARVGVLHGESVIVSSLIDITGIKRAQEALRESEQRLKLAQQIARVGTFDWDIGSGVNTWTPELEALYGLPAGGFARTEAAWEQLVHPEDRAQAIRLVEQAFETGEPTEGRWRVVWPDGSVHWLAGRWQVFKDESGKPLRMTGVNIDITERKAAEVATWESDERLRFALESCHIGAWDLDLVDHTAFHSLEHDRIFGYAQPLPQWALEDFLQHVLPEYRAEVEAMVREATAARSGWTYECRIRRADGEIRWIWFSGRHRTDLSGHDRVVGVVQDITERKRVEEELAQHREHLEELVQERTSQLETANEALRKSEERLRQRAEEVETLMDLIPAAVWVAHDPQCNHITGNQTANRLYEAYEQENVSANVSAARRFFRDGRELKPEELPMQVAAAQDIDLRDSEVDVLLPSGKWRNMLGSASPLHDADGRVRGGIAAFMDISARRQAELALRERMKELACLYAVSRDMQEEFSLDELCRRAVEHLVSAVQFPETAVAVMELNGKRFTSENYAEGLSHALQAEIRVEGEVLGHLRVYYAQERPFLIPEEQNLVNGVAEALSMWLERTRIEEALRESEEKYRRIVETATEGIAMADADARMIFINDRWLEIFGYRREEAGHVTLFDLVFPEDLAQMTDRWESRKHGRTESYEFRFRRKDGSPVWTLIGSAPRLDAEGRFLGTLVMVTDITQHKHAEEALRASEQRYRKLFEANLAGVYLTKPDGTILDFNDAMMRMLGYDSREELFQHRSTDFFADPAFRNELLRLLRRDGIVPAKEAVLRRKDGSVLYALGAGVLLADEQTGEPYIQGVALDITERRHAEEALRESEERFRALMTASSEALYRMSPDWSEMRQLHSRGFLANTEEPSRTWLQEYIDPDDQPHVTAVIQEAIRTKGIFELEHRVRRTDGSLGWTFSRAVPLLDVNGAIVEWFGAASDITERKQAEEALRAKQAELELILNQTPFMLTRCSRDLQYRYVSRAYAEMIRRTPDQVAGKPILEIMGEEAFATIRPHVEAVLQGQPVEYEAPVLYQGVGPRFLRVAYVPDKDERGYVIGWIASIIDITERKRAEESLRRSERRFKSTFENAAIGIAHVALAGHILQFNSRFCEIAGYLPEEIVGKTCEQITFADDWEAEEVQMRHLLEGRVDHYAIEKRYVRKDGGFVWVNLTRSIQRDEAGRPEHFIVIVEDISERKQAEKALRELTSTLEGKVAERTAELRYRAKQLQKLTLDMSMAEDRERERMAAILHDDLQQVLAAAKFHVGLMRNRARSDVSLQATGAQVDHMLKEAIDKSRSLSHELSPAVMHHADFAETLRWLANEVKAKYGLAVHVHAHGQVRSQSDALKALLFRAVQELLFNVVKHARVNEARILVRRLGRCLCLSVSDRGRGFEPQALGKTAGYGLLSIRERIELLGGRMTIKSAPGEGSTFRIVVPEGEPVAAPPPAGKGKTTRPAEAGLPAEGRLRVLLADDHEIVREGLISLLSEEHTVEVVGEAANGREAIDLAGRLKPDVVIMDVSMPLIEGEEATRQIKACLPQTRVIAMSMYDQSEKMEAMYRAGAESYVLKSAESEELLAAIRGKGPAH